jgi:uncharacterized protein
MKVCLSKICLIVWLAVGLPALALAQDLDFRPPASATDPSVPAVMRDLAGRILPVYQENDPERYLSNLSALQMVAGDYASAYATRQSLLERRRNANAGRPTGRALVYDIYVRARAIEAQVRTPFAKAYAQAYRDAVNRVEDQDAYTLEGWLTTPLPVLQDGLQRAFDQRRAKGSIPLNEAMDVIWAWFAYEAYRSFGALVRPLVAEESQRRYIIEDNLEIKVGKATLAATMIRPRLDTSPLPALLELAIAESTQDPREAAAHGYVGIVAYARGQRGTPGRTTPFQYDAEDAHAAIEWITKQPWSNGRVGMQGSGYSGYVAWSAAKKLPVALKAIVTSDPMAPGVDLPMSGGIFLNSAYRWTYDVMREPDEKNPVPETRWRALDEDWYKSGRRYREYPVLPGAHSALFRSWLNHPSYDRYWQKMIPFREDFSRISIPVLTMTGYYSRGEVGALYYFTQHHRYNTRANHTLLIGPWDERGMPRGAPSWLRGFQLDTAAIVDPRELRYEWLSYALKGGQKPQLLAERVNYQLAGANEWRHAPSLATLEKDRLRFYLEGNANGDRNRLAESKSEEVTFLPQTFDFADRTDASWAPAPDLVLRRLEAHNGEFFVSEPLKQPLDVAGQFTGHLDFRVNKMDADLNIAFYELTPGGEYVKLFDPAYTFRASYAQDRVKRQLLRAGQRQQLPFRSERMMGRRLQAGSRLIMLLGVSKRADQQINYGTGDDVSEESIEDADVPLRIRWYNNSYIEIPVRR